MKDKFVAIKKLFTSSLARLRIVEFAFIIIGSFFLSSCNYDDKVITIQTNGNLIIIDSSPKPKNLFNYDANNRYAYFPIYYIGKVNDTICLAAKPISRGFNGNRNNFKIGNFTYADQSKLKLIIDTSFNLTHTIHYSHLSSNEEEISDSTRLIKSFPILVYNMSDSLISVGNNSELGYTVRQAKDEHGHWKDIESPIHYFCLSNAKDIVLEPGEMLIAKLPRFNGDFKTECRLKYSRWHCTIYSNTFSDYIYKRQLTDTLLSYY